MGKTDPHTVQENRFTRLIPLMGEDGLKRLTQARVMVLGLGGVGSSCCEALARGGVGKLTLVDGDVVAPSNLNRQVIAYESTLGQPKTEVASHMVRAINPACNVTVLQAFLERGSLEEQLNALPRPDYVIDAIDTVSQKLAIAQWAQSHNIPLLASMGGAGKLYPQLLRFSDISETYGDALARVIRKECRKRHITKLEVLWSPEAAHASHTTNEQGQAILATSSYLPPIMGLMLAGRVLCELSGLGWELDQ